MGSRSKFRPPKRKNGRNWMVLNPPVASIFETCRAGFAPMYCDTGIKHYIYCLEVPKNLEGFQTYSFSVSYHPRGDVMHAYIESLGTFEVTLWERGEDEAKQVIREVFAIMTEDPTSALFKAALHRLQVAMPRDTETAGFLPGSMEEKMERLEKCRGNEEYNDFFLALEHYTYLKNLKDRYGKIPTHRSIDDE